MMMLKKIIFFPLAIFFNLISFSRNKLYDWGIIKSYSFNVPIVIVGNLAVGGTGKTPMVEFLIENFSKQYKIGVLSRGYKRKTSGFILASKNDNAKTIGDEPFQYFLKTIARRAVCPPKSPDYLSRLSGLRDPLN